MRRYYKQLDELAQVRRKQIIDAADRSFRRFGFHATTLREIADEFGMSVGHIYNYFSGKDAILEALIHHKLESVLALMTRNIPAENDTLRERFSPVLDLYLDPEVGALALAVMSEAQNNVSVLRIVRESRRKMCACLMDLVRVRHGLEDNWTPELESMTRHRIIATLAMFEGMYSAVSFDTVDREVLKNVMLDRIEAICKSESWRS